MLKEVEGIIVTETKYGETSKIVNIITKDGIIGIMAKGARTLKSPLRSCVQRFNYAKFQIYYKKDKLSILKSVDIIDDLCNIKTDIILIGYMTYISDLAYQTMKQNYNKEIYNLYINAVLKINEGLNPKIITNILELKMLDYLGVGINFNACIKCDNNKDIITIDGDEGGYICKNCYNNEIVYSNKTLQMLRMYYLVELPSISDLKITDEVVNNINNFMKQYYDRYTGLYLKSKTFLEEITKE